ncbi:MAG: amidohydrolase family protein, partial [Roseibium sp.]
VAKVVGWIEFEDPSQREVLARFAQHPKFAGVRPMIQDIENDTWMLRDDVQWAYEVLIELDLTFDCLGFPRHLPHFHNLLTRYPDLRAVIDHCMKPQVRAPSDENFATWSEGMSALAEDTNACCKLSGLVTEADDDWSDARLRPYTDHVIKAFGHDRVMWGSDWPVARLRCEYPDWHAQALRLISRFGDAAKLSVFNDTAQQFYRIT